MDDRRGDSTGPNEPSSNPARGGIWRDDPLFPWAVAAAFVFLVAVTGILITAFPRSGFWPWFVEAGAIVIVWILAVVIFAPRSGTRH